MDYMLKIRSFLGLYELPMATSALVGFMDKFFLNLTNTKLAGLSLPWLSPIEKFDRLDYTREGTASATLASFRYDMANIGRKYPRVGRVGVTQHCPLCRDNSRNTVQHLAMFCPLIEKIRKEQTSIASFRNTCLFKGFSEDYTFALFLNGKDWNENPVPLTDFLDRGVELKQLLDTWLSKW